MATRNRNAGQSTPVSRPTADQEVERAFEGLATPTFSEQDQQYTEDEWWLPASDARGHSITISTKIPPQWDRAIDVLTASNEFRRIYKTKGDFVRHAIHRHLYWLHHFVDQVPRDAIYACSGILDVCRSHAEKQIHEEAIHAAKEALNRLKNDSTENESLKLMQKFRFHIEQMTKGPKRRELETEWVRMLEKYCPIAYAKFAEHRGIAAGSGAGAGGSKPKLLPKSDVLSLPKPKD